MDFTIYAGESVLLPIDLDTSKTDAAYDITGRTLVFRVAPLGTSTTVLEVTPTVTDESAGTLAVELDSTDTASLLGQYEVQLIDTDQPLVMATGVLAVMQMLGAVPPW